MRLNSIAFVLWGTTFILLSQLGCTLPGSDKGSNEYTLSKVKALPYRVPKDSISALVQSQIGVAGVSLPQRQAPNIIAGRTNVFPAPLPAAITIEEHLLRKIQPGQGQYSKPRTFKAEPLVVKVGVPAVVVAKERVSKDQNPYNFSTLGKLQGLPHSVITAVTEDQRGNLWIGTLGSGVCKFDGKYFTYYTNETGLPNNSITCILEDQRGNLWFGTDGSGIVKYDGRQFSCFLSAGELDNSLTTAPAEDQQGNIWIGSYSGLLKYDGKNFTQYAEKEGLDSNEVLSLLISRSGKIWLGTWGAGAYCFDGLQFTQFNTQNGLIHDAVACIAEDQDGDLWFGTERGLSRYKNGAFYNYAAPKYGLQETPISCLRVLQNGELWLGTLGSGLSKYDGQQFTHFREADGLSYSGILSIFEDSSNNLWFGTDGGGLMRYSGHLFTHLSTAEGLSSNEVFSIFEDQRKQLWFGTAGGGVTRFDGQNFVQYTEASGLNHDFIYSILQDKKNNLWFGTNGKGLMKFDGQSFQQYLETDDLLNQVRCLMEDRQGNLWLGTSAGGAIRLEGASRTYFSQETGLSSNNVLCIREDHNGNIWFGTLGGGVTVYTKKGFQHYQQGNGLSHNDVSSILCDRQGRIWLGTLGGGLNCFDGKHFIHFTEKEGLCNNAVLSLLQDHWGNLWIGTRFGLSKMSAAMLDSILPMGQRSKQPIALSPSRALFKNFTYEDGFLGIGCWRNSLFEATNGDIYIGANDRLTIYHPNGELSNNNKPQVNLVGLALYHEDVPWSVLQSKPDSNFVLSNGVILKNFRFSDLTSWNDLPQNLSLRYNNNNISFSFVGSKLQQPEKVKYQYKLEGLENIWSNLSTANEAAFGNLAPGRYTFRLRAMSSTGVWSDDLSYAFTIRPPWWRSWWMYTIYAALVIGVIIWFRRQELQQQARQLALERQKTEQEQQINEQLRRVDTLKDQFLANTSHELRTPLQGIIGLSESLIERVDNVAQRADLEMIISSSRRLNSLVNDILDFSKIKNQEIALQLEPLSLYALADVVLRNIAPLAQGKALSLRNDVPKDFPAVLADENRLQQVIFNLLGNAIKFTETGHITIQAQEDPKHPDMLTLCVQDTGIGVPEDKREAIFQAFEQGDGSLIRNFAGTGLGLSISKKLVELHGGQMWLESTVGQGSSFYFTLQRASGISSTEIQRNSQLTQNTLAQLAWSQNEPVPAPALVETKPGGGEKVHILIVDDEAINQQVLKNFLNHDSYRLTQVMSGEEALQVLEQDDTLDLVLLDVMMPRMSGYEVCQKIREKYLPNELPVIMITAKNQVSDLITGLNTGANDYIAKPFSKDEFLARLNTHLNLHKINMATQRFVPTEFIRSLGHESISDVRLGDHVEQIVTVLFADIRGYTALAESMTPEENFRFVADYNQRMGPLIQKNKGFINQYLGDGIMAIFTRNPAHALQAAIAIQKELSSYNVQRLNQGLAAIEVGVGLHTGPLIMGIIGDQKRLDAATIADTVNTASRLEGLTKYYGSHILLSEDSLKHIENPSAFQLRNLGQVQVKGKYQSTLIFECFEGDDPSVFAKKQATQDLFDQALQAYFQKSFAEAIQGFEQVVLLNPHDFTAQLFLEKASTYAVNGVPSDWLGIEMMTEK
jgi:two-component system, sensor histidine kinase ChiS